MLKLFLAALAAVFLAAIPALADTPLGNTVITVPWGDVVAGIVPVLSTLILGGLLWIAQTVAPPLYGILRTAQVEQLMTKAVDFGLNAVAGAAKGQVLTVDVGNEVVKEIVTYGLTHGGQWFIDFAGTPEEIAQKAYARLNLEQSAAKPDFAEIATQAQLAAFGPGA